MHFPAFLALVVAGVVTLANPIKPLPRNGVYIGDINEDGTTTLEYQAPLKTRNGVYIGNADAAGNPSLEYKAPLSTRTTENLEERTDQKGVGCDWWGKLGLDAYDTDHAVQSVRDYCTSFPDDCKHRTAVAQSGDVVAFFCFWRSGASYNVDSFSAALGYVTDQCGAYTAGSFSDTLSESTRTYSYGYTNWRSQSYCNIPAGRAPGT